MIELVILACLVSSPDACKEARLTAPANLTPQQCLMNAQPHIARWFTENPSISNGRYVKKFKCVRQGRIAFPESGRDA